MENPQGGCQMSKIYGYVRVSSKDQNEERQLIAMKEFGVPDNLSTLISKVIKILTDLLIND